MNPELERLGAAIAAYGLSGSEARLPEAVEGRSWKYLIATSKHLGLTGLLAQAAVDGAIRLSSDQASEVYQLHNRAMSIVVALERSLLDVVAVLEDEGLDYRVIKGSASAHLDYADPGWRSFSDVDLLLRSEQWDAAVQALAAAGHRRVFLEPRSGFDRRFSKGTVFKLADGHELDLHRTLVSGPFGQSVVLNDLWHEPATFEIGGQGLKALPAEERLLNACFHAAIGDMPPKLAMLRDVAQLALVADLKTDYVLGRAGAWAAEAVIARAVNMTWEQLALADRTALSAWARRYQPDPDDLAAIDVYLDRRQNSTALSLAAVRAIPGFRDKASYVRALAFPDPAFFANRYRSRRQRWLHAISVLQRRPAP